MNVLPQEADGEEHRGYGEAVGDRRRRTAEIPRGAAAPVVMMVAAAQPEWEGNPENPRGGSSPTDGGLTESTHMARLEPASQGVARLTDRENRGRRPDDTTDGRAGV